ncbi:MAG: hypothetical protein U0L05_06120 [Schaedlerella sp.]|nr:hypothetical protein [Schaedlerella sp.]
MEKMQERIKDYEFQMQAAQMLMTELNKKLGNLSVEQRNVEQEKERLREVYKEHCSNILQQYSESLRTLSAEFTQILDNITNLQQNIIEADLMEEFYTEIEEKESVLLEEKMTEETEVVD